MAQLFLPLTWSLLHQGKKLPPNIDENAEEGDVSDEDSADEMEDDCKLMNGDVCSLSGLFLHLNTFISSVCQSHMCPDDEKSLACLFPVTDVRVSTRHFLLPSCLCYHLYLCSLLLSLSVAICSHFLLFSLPVCSSFFLLFFFFSPTVACFFQSGRYCMKKLILYHSRDLIQSCAILSHPACECVKW